MILIALLVVFVCIIACQCRQSTPVAAKACSSGSSGVYYQPPQYDTFTPHRPVMPRTQFERIADAENDQWFAAMAADEESPDYTGYLTDLVTDPRTRETHKQWVEEMKPWSGTAITVDNMDEAMEASTSFLGLRRPQAAPQYNPYFVTELDPSTFKNNPKFIFQG